MNATMEDVLRKLTEQLHRAIEVLEEERKAEERRIAQSRCDHVFAYYGDSVECTRCGYPQYCG